MTKGQRQQVIEALDRIYGQVSLMCDGYRLTLVRMPINPTTNRVLVYVNGSMSAKWMLEDCEERRRFYCPHSQYLHSKREREAYKKIGQRTLKKWKIDPDKKHVSFTPWWASSSRLVRHLEKHSQEVTLIEEKQEVTA